MIFKIHNGHEQTEFEHDPPESVHVVGHVASAVENSNNITVSLLKNNFFNKLNQQTIFNSITSVQF